MAQKAIILCSSPNPKGKTANISDLAANYMEKVNIHGEVKFIGNLHYNSNGCIACNKCQETDKYECVIRDEASPILESLANYDHIIFATPIYFFGANAQLKLLLDRVYSLYKFDEKNMSFETPLKNKTLGLIATADGGLDAGLTQTEETFKAIADFTNMNFESLLVPNSSDYKDNITGYPGIQDKTMDFVQRIQEKSLIKGWAATK